MEFARIASEAVVVTLIALEPVKNAYLNNFVKRLIPAFILEVLLIAVAEYIKYMELYAEYRILTWRTFEIIRIFISLSLCYPMSLFIGETGQKVQRLFMIVCGLMVIGTTSDLLGYRERHSGMNYVSFLLIFLYTLYQYNQLRQRTEGEIPRLKSLIFIETILIILDVILILLFLGGARQIKFFTATKNAMEFIQLQKFYMMILVMTYFN